MYVPELINVAITVSPPATNLQQQRNIANTTNQTVPLSCRKRWKFGSTNAWFKRARFNQRQTDARKTTNKSDREKADSGALIAEKLPVHHVFKPKHNEPVL